MELAALVGAVVEMESTAVAGEVPVIFTELTDPKLRAGGNCAPAGLDVTTADSETVPTKP
jgi:hypothetical protein